MKPSPELNYERGMGRIIEGSRERKPHFDCLCFAPFHISHNSSLADHTTPTSPHAGRKRLLKQQPSQETETVQ